MLSATQAFEKSNQTIIQSKLYIPTYVGALLEYIFKEIEESVAGGYFERSFTLTNLYLSCRNNLPKIHSSHRLEAYSIVISKLKELGYAVDYDNCRSSDYKERLYISWKKELATLPPAKQKSWLKKLFDKIKRL